MIKYLFLVEGSLVRIQIQKLKILKHTHNYACSYTYMYMFACTFCKKETKHCIVNNITKVYLSTTPLKP